MIVRDIDTAAASGVPMPVSAILKDRYLYAKVASFWLCN
eukprot:COSAG01_NODE_66796_length_269_cov_0.564706_1_plen_38_part_10